MRWTGPRAAAASRDDPGATLGFARARARDRAPRRARAAGARGARRRARSAPRSRSAAVIGPVHRRSSRTGHLGPGPADDPLRPGARRRATTHDATFPASIQDPGHGRTSRSRAGRFRVQKETTDPAFVRLRIQEGIADHIRYVDGRPPTGAVTTRNDVGPGAGRRRPRLRGGDLARRPPSGSGCRSGETVPLVGDPGDQLIGRTRAATSYAFATITGIYEAIDPDADCVARRPAAGPSGDPRAVARGPAARRGPARRRRRDRAALTTTMRARAGRCLRYSWREFLDPDAAQRPRRSTGLITDFRRLQVAVPVRERHPGQRTSRCGPGMLPILEAHRARWAAAAGDHHRRSRSGRRSSRSRRSASSPCSPRAGGARRWRSPGAAAPRGAGRRARSSPRAC